MTQFYESIKMVIKPFLTITDFGEKGILSWRFRPSNMENCSPWVCILGESRFKITVDENILL